MIHFDIHISGILMFNQRVNATHESILLLCISNTLWAACFIILEYAPRHHLKVVIHLDEFGAYLAGSIGIACHATIEIGTIIKQ